MEKKEEKKEEFLLDEVGEMGEEEVIELVDVLEEPEQKMSIDDFLSPEKEEPFGEITPLESWGKLLEEEKPSEGGLPPPVDKVSAEIMFPLFEKEAILEEEPFEKIDLEEVLQKVEEIKPSLQKELSGGEEVKVSEETPLLSEAPAEKGFNFEEFEAALQMGIKTEPMEEEIQPFLKKDQKAVRPEEPVPIELATKEEELEELPEEEFPEVLLEEELGEEELGGIEGVKEERVRIEEMETPKLFKEEIRPEVGMAGKSIEEMITKRVEEMMVDFTKTVIPEIAKNIIGNTMDRIEKMVKEIVPDLAEKVIHEEIKRLQKEEGEKE